MDEFEQLEKLTDFLASFENDLNDNLDDDVLVSPSPARPGVSLKVPLLRCSLCKKEYQQPKMLPCHHSFCATCLESVVPESSLTVSCPNCGIQSILPPDGINDLQDSTVLSHMVSSLSKDTSLASNEKSSSESGYEDSTLSFFSSGVNNMAQNSESLASKTPMTCLVHEKEDLLQFCVDCDAAVCAKCTEIGHSEHSIVTLCSAIEEQRIGIQSVVIGAKKQLEIVRSAQQNIMETEENLKSNYSRSRDHLTELFLQISKEFEAKQTELLQELDSVYCRKMNVLSDQKHEMSIIEDNIKACCDFVDERFAAGSDEEVILLNKEVTEKLNDFVEAAIEATPEENDYIQICPSSRLNGVSKSFQNIASIETSSALPHRTKARSTCFNNCIVNIQNVVKVKPFDAKFNLDDTANLPVSGILTSCATGENVDLKGIHKKSGDYELDFILTEPGAYQLDIQLFGKSIQNSPFHILCRQSTKENTKVPTISPLRSLTSSTLSSNRSSASTLNSFMSSNNSNIYQQQQDHFVMQIGAQGKRKGEFCNPQGVCLNPNGRILVTDSNNQSVQMFSYMGECVMRFGSKGRGSGRIQRPVGVAMSRNGNYLVSDFDNRCITVFDPDGKYVSRFGVNRLHGPKGIAVNSKGQIIVADNRANSILVFEPTGKLVHKFGGRPTQASSNSLAGPHFVAVNGHNDIIVSDFHNHCVKVFDCEGNFKFKIGQSGDGCGQFNCPTGVAVDSFGNILVSDWGNCRIQVFDRTGHFMSHVNTFAHPLYAPQDIAIGLVLGHVIVCDSGNHCIKVFQYSTTPPINE